jgi:hypothetical protein
MRPAAGVALAGGAGVRGVWRVVTRRVPYLAKPLACVTGG